MVIKTDTEDKCALDRSQLLIKYVGQFLRHVSRVYTLARFARPFSISKSIESQKCLTSMTEGLRHEAIPPSFISGLCLL